MSDQDNKTPCVYLVRHAWILQIGETEWAKCGRYTGSTDIELTQAGAAQVSSTAMSLVGVGKLIEPSRLVHILVSPRKRARTTLELLLPHLSEKKVNVTEDIAEWDYGDYEGLKAGEIRDLRKGRGLDMDKKWNIWRDGCEGGESMQQVTLRLDRLISEIREIQRPYINGEQPADVLIVCPTHLSCYLPIPLSLHPPFFLLQPLNYGN
ncbi:hypothetical protein PG995_006369 [Apiospora arundinis]